MKKNHSTPVRNRYLIIMLLIMIITVLFGCTAGGERFTAENTAGFWMGLWHGIIAVIAFFVSLFNNSVNVYEVHNSGAWYDFGFLLGIVTVWGGGSCTTACTRKKSPDELREEAEWKETEIKVEKKLKRKLREWAESDEDEDWEEIGKKLEKKIKRKLKEWAEEE